MTIAAHGQCSGAGYGSRSRLVSILAGVLVGSVRTDLAVFYGIAYGHRGEAAGITAIGILKFVSGSTSKGQLLPLSIEGGIVVIWIGRDSIAGAVIV